MTQYVDFVALGWVEENLREEMDAAKKCLQLYQRESDEIGHLSDAQRNIHSATGALRLCALDPAALLTEEIERVLSHLISGKIAGEARKLAMTEVVAAIEALPAYLANVRAKREVSAGSIAGVVNDLRSFGNRAPLPGSLFFDPPLPEGAGVSKGKAPVGEDHLKEFSSRAMSICHRYSKPALERDHQALKRLYAVGKHAHPMLAGSAMEPYFRCYMGLIEVLAQSHARPDEVIVEVLKHCFGFMKSMSHEGSGAIDGANPTPYIKKMLYYIARTPTPTALQKSLRDTFNVHDVEEFSTGGSGRLIQEDDLLDALGHTQSALLEVMEFMTARDQVISSSNSTLVDTIVPQLKQVGVQLGVIGLEEQAAKVALQYEHLKQLSERAEPAPQSDLIDFGGALIAVKESVEYKLKNGLSAHGDGTGQDLENAINEQVVRCLGEIKDSINREFSRQDVQEFLEEHRTAPAATLVQLRPLYRGAKLVAEPALRASMQEWEDKYFPSHNAQIDTAETLLANLDDASYVQRAVTGMEQVLSVLGLMDDKQRECTVLAKCARFITESASMGGLVNDAAMENFAEAIAALEQYMECRTQDPLGNSEEHLDRAESRADMLEVFLTQKAVQKTPSDNIVELGFQAGEEKAGGQADASHSLSNIVEFVSAAAESKAPATQEEPTELAVDTEVGSETSLDVTPEVTLDANPDVVTEAAETQEEETFAIVEETASPGDSEEQEPSESAVDYNYVEYVDSTEASPTIEPVTEDIVDDVQKEQAHGEANAFPELDSVLEAAEVAEASQVADVSAAADDLQAASAELDSNVLHWKDALDLWLGQELDRGPDAPLEDPTVDIDEELVECFVEEGRKHIRKLDDALPRFSAELHNETVIQEIRAVFHTMKGSARTIELNEFGEFMYDMEKVFNALRDGYITGTSDIAEFVQEVSNQLTPYVDLLMQRVPLYTSDFIIPAAIATSITEKRFDSASQLELARAGEDLVSATVLASDEAAQDIGVEEISQAEPVADIVEETADTQAVAADEGAQYESPNDYEVDLFEEETVAELVGGQLNEPVEETVQVEEAVEEDGLELFSVDEMADIVETEQAEVELAEAEQAEIEQAEIEQAEVEQAEVELAEAEQAEVEQVELDQQVIELDDVGVEASDTGSADFEIQDFAPAAPLEPDSTQPEDETLVAYSAEIWQDNGAEEIMNSVSALLSSGDISTASGSVANMAQDLVRSVVPALVELRDGEFLELGEHNFSFFLELPVLEHLASDAVFGLVDSGDGEYTKHPISTDATALLRNYLDKVSDDGDAMEAAHVEAESLLRTALSLPEPEAPMEPQPVSQAEEAELTADVGDLEEEHSEDSNVLAFTQAEQPEPSQYQVEDIDLELLDLFIETIDEYLESVDSAMSALREGDSGAMRSLRNTLHTVKGAANSIGLRRLGALVHEFEDRLGDIEHAGDVGSSASIHKIDGLVDGLNEAAEFVRRRKTDWDPTATEASEFMPAVAEDDETITSPVADVQVDDAGSERRVNTLRIETHRIDRLLDIGLEISMSNVRCRHSLDAAQQDRNEVQGLARRVQTLVDKLSLQLDTEIQAKTESLSSSEHFDPLEMDRMTEKQSLAAILREAAYDLQEEAGALGTHLDAAMREGVGSSRLLQSNQSDLRMLRLVNFSKLGPGLRRLVHQVSRQLGKHVEFDFTCSEGGLDISVFEQLRIALEHMLRNAIDHGIGKPEERIAQGKAESGNIKLLILRQGSEFVIRLLDDGNGIEPELVRKKAIEQALVGEQEQFTDDEALRLIFRAGLSTAGTVTDVSGRGVGMDVVYQSVTQVGGSIEVQSKAGFYTQFDIRVPASIMVNGALLASIGEEQVAVPLTSLEGSDFRRRDDIHREASVADGRITFRDEEYQLRYLGTVRGGLPVPGLDVLPEFVPVLFAKLDRRRVAFFVDALDNAEEMVIRSLGAQFTGVPGIAGGAVKSDGQPVLALDLNEFIGQVDYADEVVSVAIAAADNTTLILCVDDSVMMRRTYEKRLQSLGYKVATAVDGEDALDYLSQAGQMPDFIFTDLEMPNMNGFDFIANLRRVPAYEHIPTVVVSSRDAEKHRSEATRVGATDFMAKGANSADGMRAVIQRHLTDNALAS